MADNKREDYEAYVTSPSFQSLSGSGLLTSTLKFCLVSLNFDVF